MEKLLDLTERVILITGGCGAIGRVVGRVLAEHGATYRTSWMAALASNPDWITITTFNEWFEGAMIEPSVHYGNLYLDLTAQYAKLWHG